MDAFEAACKESTQAHPLAPGDIVLVNNRICLHVRSEVGEEYGAKSRWLLRTYGLDTTSLEPSQLQSGSTHNLFP